MSVKAIVYLLQNNVTLTGTVAATQIMGGPLEQGTALPGISVTQVSRIEVDPKVNAPSVKVWRTRVQVTVMANTYADLRSVMDLVRAALPRSRGTVNGVNVDTIEFDSEGPDFDGDQDGIFAASLDYIVTFTE